MTNPEIDSNAYEPLYIDPSLIRWVADVLLYDGNGSVADSTHPAPGITRTRITEEGGKPVEELTFDTDTLSDDDVSLHAHISWEPGKDPHTAQPTSVSVEWIYSKWRTDPYQASYMVWPLPASRIRSEKIIVGSDMEYQYQVTVGNPDVSGTEYATSTTLNDTLGQDFTDAARRAEGNDREYLPLKLADIISSLARTLGYPSPRFAQTEAGRRLGRTPIGTTKPSTTPTE